MTSGLLSPSRLDRAVPVERRLEDRWQVPASSLGRFSLGMSAVLLASLAVHALIVTLALVKGAPEIVPPQQEIAVEIVQEAPKPPVQAPKPPAADLKPAEAPAKPEAKAAPPPSEPAKVEAAKPDTLETDPPKAEPLKAEPPAKDAAKEPTKEPPKPVANAEDAKALASQLEALKAEHAALEAEQQEATAEAAADAKAEPQSVPRAPADTGLGPLPASFQAVALPASSDGAGEAIGYQQLVFSQLAKANEIGKTKGVPGSTGVHFVIDEKGALVSVAIAHKSGIPSLDADALAIVRKAAPFPAPPQGAQRIFDANVNFVAESQR